jgi:hypothetical protein
VTKSVALGQLIVLLLTITVGAHARPARQAEPGSSCFSDEAPQDSGLLAARNQLRLIVKAHDLGALRRATAGDVYFSDRLKGVDAFVRLYRLADPTSLYWRELEQAVARPGKLLKPGFYCAPYFMCPVPPPYGPDYVVILAPNVPAMSEPRKESLVLDRLSCEVVKAAGDDLPKRSGETRPEWTAVFLTAGRWAYVENRYLGDPYGMYIEIEKRNGRWMLASFAGID